MAIDIKQTREQDDDINTRLLYGMDGHPDGVPFSLEENRRSMVFFTRPQLNLSDNTLENVRVFSEMLTPDDASIPRFIRTTLDPYIMDPAVNNTPLKCPLVDNKQSFIPVLTNTCVKVDGWPSQEQSTYVSTPGRAKEIDILPDDEPKVDGPFDINCVFTPPKGHVVSKLLETWAAYGGYRFSGHLNRYMNYIVAGWKDDTCRLFILHLDSKGQSVERIGSTLPGQWIISSDGSRYDHDRKTKVSVNPEVTYPLRVPSVITNDPGLLYSFNDIVTFHNGNMIDELRYTSMRLIKPHLIVHFSNLIYYRIDPSDNRLERWVAKDPAIIIANKLLNEGIVTDIDDVFDSDRAFYGRNIIR